MNFKVPLQVSVYIEILNHRYILSVICDRILIHCIMCRKTQEEAVCVSMFFWTRLSSWVHLGSIGGRRMRKAELPEKRDLEKYRDQT